MSGRTRAKAFAWLTVCVCASAPALADDAPAPAAAAPSDPKQACIAAVEVGQTQRDDGKYRQARASFLACAQDTCPRVIQQSCTKWLRELDESAPTIVLAAKDEQGNDLTDVSVTFDGSAFVTQLDGKPVEVDAGEHLIRFERGGRTPVEQKLLLRAGEKARLISVVLRPLNATEGPPPPEATFSAHHVVSVSAGVAALAAVAVGSYFVAESGHQKGTAEGLRSGALSDSTACYSPGPSVLAMCQSLGNAVHAQHDDMNIATGLFVGAGVLAVGAVASWLLWPKAHGDEPQTTAVIAPLPGGAGVQLSGTFR
jgi:hypothetical protein